MDEMVYVRARRAAAELLSLTWDGRLPVRLTDVTNELGAVKYESDLGPLLSGIVSKEPKQQPIIVLHADQSPERRRFTWAHELGHIVDRSIVSNRDEYSFSDGRGVDYNLHEFFADEFAGALLMPAEEILRMQKEGYTRGQMAIEFGVSVSALETRLRRLAKQPDVVGASER